MKDHLLYDTSELLVSGINIAESVNSVDTRLIYNESYVVIGENLKAASVFACYDLTVIGNVEVEDIEIGGSLYVMGDIKSKRISCSNSIICNGRIDSEEILGSEIIAGDITCHTVSCPGNIMVKNTIDVSESLSCKKSVLTGEGILGDGRFSVKNAVAAEYFDFSGDVKGKIIELETDASYGQPDKEDTQGDSFSDYMRRVIQRIEEELEKSGEVDEEELVALVSKLSNVDKYNLSDWKQLMDRLVDLSYTNKIVNLLDYLIVVMAKRIMPVQVTCYETVEHVFSQLLPLAEKDIDLLPFHASNVEELAYALKVAVYCEEDLVLSKDEVLDRIFQSIGIKYKTVQTFLKR